MDDHIRQKGIDRVQINNILVAVCLGMLALLVSLPRVQPSIWLLSQLGCAIPSLVVSSLAYAKTRYRPEVEFHAWDRLGWIAHSLAFVMIYNAMALLFYTYGYRSAAWLFIGATVVSQLAYSTTDVLCKRGRVVERAWKLVLFVVLLAAGSVGPILLGVL